ncbi:MAG: hypothetical protein K8S99_09850 [Planctomycetes bacterium]|nr:hypothetical protein [Planctomycetota bacterium]
MQPVCYAADDWFTPDARPPTVGGIPAAITAAGLCGLAWPLAGDDGCAPLREIAAALDRTNLKLVAVEWRMDIHSAAPDPRVDEVLRLLAGRETLLDVTLVSTSPHDAPSAPRGDRRAAALLTDLLDRAEPLGVPLSLSPRHGCWLARTEDAVRLGMRLNRAALGTTFHLTDWRQADGDMLDARLDIAIPRLANVTLDDAGDATRLVQRLLTAGYAGPIGLQKSVDTPIHDWTGSLRAASSAYSGLVTRARR